MSAAQNLPTTNVSLETFWELVAANLDKRLEYRDGVVIDKDAVQDQPAATISVEAFWELVAANPDKRLEYRKGFVVEKVVADSSNHAHINSNCEILLRSALHGKCSVFPLGMYVQTMAERLYMPDVSVTSVGQSHDECTILFAPELVVEVVPRSTVAFDSLTKVADYRDCVSITTNLKISHNKRHIEVHERESRNVWKIRTLIDAERYQLRHFPIMLELDAVYRGIRLGA